MSNIIKIIQKGSTGKRHIDGYYPSEVKPMICRCRCVREECNKTFRSTWGSKPLCYSCFLKWAKCITQEQKNKFWKQPKGIKKGKCLIDSEEED